MKNNSPHVLIAINQSNGEFSLVGNSEGLSYLNKEIESALDAGSLIPEGSLHKLDAEITHDLKQIVVGEKEVQSALSIIDLYNSASGMKEDINILSRILRISKQVIKVIWLYILPILGLWLLLVKLA